MTNFNEFYFTIRQRARTLAKLTAKKFGNSGNENIAKHQNFFQQVQYTADVYTSDDIHDFKSLTFTSDTSSLDAMLHSTNSI